MTLLENFDYSGLIELFKVSPIVPDKVNVKKIQELALKKGYIVHPDCCNKSVYGFLYYQLGPVDINSTFYKTWNDVISKNRLEILFDQIISYTATYVLGESWVPNEGSDVIDFSKYTVIKPITFEELYEKCLEMIQSGIALKTSTVLDLCKYIKEYYISQDNAKLDIDSIKNREAQTYLCSELGITPNDKFNLLRYIVFKTTDETMLIKNMDLINKIKTSINPFDLSSLSEEQLKELASIFYRFKDIFLAFRKHINNCSWIKPDKLLLVQVAKNREIINKLRRLAPKYHKPFKAGFWETLLQNKNVTDNEIRENAKNTTNFKLVRMIQAINMHLCNPDKKLYVIRNGKTFIKDMSNVNEDFKTLNNYKKVLKDILVERLKSKACVVKYPKGLVLTCPTSEKNFIGDIPFGSYYKMGQDNYFGIYWRNDWGAHDFDLSFISEDGSKIGWNSQWYNGNKNVIYSGDVTNAPDGASEVILAKNNCPNGIININRFSGNQNSMYQFFFGKSDTIKNYPNGYMVDPNTIMIQTTNYSESPQESIGAVIDNKAYLFKLGVAGGRVSTASRFGTSFLDLMYLQVRSFMTLSELLGDAGFTDYNDIDWTMCKEEDFEILDLSVLNRDTLISLFS